MDHQLGRIDLINWQGRRNRRQALALIKMPEGKPLRLPAAWAAQWNL